MPERWLLSFVSFALRLRASLIILLMIVTDIEGLVILSLLLLRFLISRQGIPPHKEPLNLFFGETAPAHQASPFAPHLSAHRWRRKIPDLRILTLIAPAHAPRCLPAKVGFCA